MDEVVHCACCLQRLPDETPVKRYCDDCKRGVNSCIGHVVLFVPWVVWSSLLAHLTVSARCSTLYIYLNTAWQEWCGYLRERRLVVLPPGIPLRGLALAVHFIRTFCVFRADNTTSPPSISRRGKHGNHQRILDRHGLPVVFLTEQIAVFSRRRAFNARVAGERVQTRGITILLSLSRAFHLPCRFISSLPRKIPSQALQSSPQALPNRCTFHTRTFHCIPQSWAQPTSTTPISPNMSSTPAARPRAHA